MKKRRVLNLRELRKAKGWTQQDLAERAGVNLSNYNAIENGRGRGFKVVMKQGIANVLGVNLFDLFPEEREKVEEICGGRRQLQMFIPREEIKRD